MIKFLDLNLQYQTLKNEIDSAIASIIHESAFVGGRYVRQFEDHFAEFQGVSNCVGVGNGTDALEIAIEALEMPPNSEIIVPANSFIASSEAVTRSGHNVLFCDVNTDDYTISAGAIKDIISEKTAAIMAVHLYGHPCDMDQIIEIATEYNLRIIEDCAQAHGAEYKGQRVGGIGDIGTFSFYPGKNLGAYGDGGAIVTNNEKLATKCRMIANHGRIAKYDHDFEGRNSRLDGLQAAILDVKLCHLEEWTEYRINIADNYIKKFKDVTDVILPKSKGWARHVYHLFVVRTKKRDQLKKLLESNDIQTGIHYPVALPLLEAYSYVKKDYKNTFAAHMGKELLSLPIGTHIHPKDVQKIVDLVSINL